MANGSFNLKTLASFVTASIFSGCIIPPLFQSFWDASTNKGHTLLDAYKNSLYMNAAVGNRNWIDYLVLTILIVLVTVVPVVLVATYALRSPQKKKAKDGDDQGKRFTLGLLFAPLLLVNFIAGLLVINYAYSDLQLNASFEQYITALRPMLSEVEERQWRSEWALMESEEDCAKIFALITKKSEEVKIALPKKLYF